MAEKGDIASGCTMVRWERSFNGKHWAPITAHQLSTLETNFVNQAGSGRFELEEETADFDSMRAFDGQTGRQSMLRRVEFYDLLDWLILFRGVDLSAGFPQYVQDLTAAVKTAWQSKHSTTDDPPTATVRRPGPDGGNPRPTSVYCYPREDFDCFEQTYSSLSRRPSAVSLHPGLHPAPPAPAPKGAKK